MNWEKRVFIALSMVAMLTTVACGGSKTKSGEETAAASNGTQGSAKNMAAKDDSMDKTPESDNAAQGTAKVVGANAPPSRKDDANLESKNGKFEAEISGVKTVIHYGRPKVKGRKIWGELVPYGAIWRTGANEATTISLYKDAKVQGQTVKAGTYALFTIPEQEKWTLILNSEPKQWGAYRRDESKDVLKVEMVPKEAPKMAEELTFFQDGDDVVIHWEKVAVPFSIKPAS